MAERAEIIRKIYGKASFESVVEAVAQIKSPEVYEVRPEPPNETATGEVKLN